MNKFAVIADIHGNYHALKAVLEDIKKRNINTIYCLGDLYAPYASNLIWPLLKNIPTVLGNGDERLLKDKWTSIRYLLARTCRESIQNTAIDKIRELPLTIVLEECKTILCHGTPESNSDFLIYYSGNENRIIAEFPEYNILSGHAHIFRVIERSNKKYATIGSVGLAFYQESLAEYSIITPCSEEIEIESILVKYDDRPLIDRLITESFIKKNGPVGLLAFDEIVSHEERIHSFFWNYGKNREINERNIYKECKRYLKQIGRWEDLSQYVEQNYT